MSNGGDGSRVLTRQLRTVEFVDASLERTRLVFKQQSGMFTSDSITLVGFVPVPPGAVLEVVISYTAEEGTVI